MSLFVNTNVASLNAQRKLALSTRNLDTDYSRLASGLRINSAKDDAAGLQISDRLTTQINGLNQGCRNAQDGISMLQTAEGALEEITESLQRIRVLAIQSANGTNSAEDRQALQQEVEQRCLEINRIAKDTTYAGFNILDGEQAYKFSQETYSYPKDTKEPYKTLKPISSKHPGANGATKDPSRTNKNISYQIGADANQTIEVNFGLFTNKVMCDQGCKKLFDTKAYLSFDLNGLYCTSADPNKPETRIYDPDSADSTRNTGFIIGSDGNLCLDVSTPEGAQNIIRHVAGYIETIDGKRAEFGAVQNRLESSIRNSLNVAENVSSARSEIRDTDFAAQTSKMIQDNIINQASSAILSQANSLPNLALSLLKND